MKAAPPHADERVPLGRALSLEEMTKLAEITLDDVQRAADRWRRDADPEFAGLLDAAPDPPIPTAKPKRKR